MEGPSRSSFSIQPWGGDWTELRAWGPSNIYDWTPTNGGGYNLAAYVRDDTGAIAKSMINYTITGGGGGGGGTCPGTPITGLVLAPSLASPQPVGTMVQYTATASGGGAPYMYQFLVQPVPGGLWEVKQDWSTTSTFNWLASPAGAYNVAVLAKACESDVIIKSALYYVVTGPGGGGGGTTCTGSGSMSTITLTTDPVSPAPANSTIQLTAVGADGMSPYQYQYWIQPIATGVWELLRDWSPMATYGWMPTTAGNYNIAVYGRGCEKEEAEVKAAIYYSVTAGSGGGSGGGGGGGGDVVTGVGLTVAPEAGGFQITAAASGGTAVEYQFWVQPWGGSWTILRAWGTSQTASWPSPASGGYNLGVEARSGSSGPGQAQALINFVVP